MCVIVKIWKKVKERIGLGGEKRRNKEAREGAGDRIGKGDREMKV